MGFLFDCFFFFLFSIYYTRCVSPLKLLNTVRLSRLRLCYGIHSIKTTFTCVSGGNEPACRTRFPFFFPPSPVLLSLLSKGFHSERERLNICTRRRWIVQRSCRVKTKIVYAKKKIYIYKFISHDSTGRVRSQFLFVSYRNDFFFH